MRSSNSAPLIGVPGLVLGLALIGLGACKDKQDRQDPHSLSNLDAEGPPHTADCRSWEDIDVSKLPALPAGAHVEAFDTVWRTVAQKHFDPTLACLDWPAIRASYGERVAAAADAQAAYAIINEMLGLLGQSHLHATPPTAASTRERDTGPAMVPIAVRWLPMSPKSEDRRAVVVDGAVGGNPSGVPLGAVLTSVDGESIDEIAKEVIAVGGDVRVTEQAFQIRRAIDATLSCPADGRKTISFLDPKDDAARELAVACFVPDGERISLGNLRNLPTTVDWHMIGAAPAGSGDTGSTEGDDGGTETDTGGEIDCGTETGDEPETAPTPDAPDLGDGPGEPKVGYLAFNFWMLPMVDRVREGVTTMRAQGMQALIIDLRDNPGGVGAMSIPIARMFVDRPASLGRLQMREFNQEFRIDANPDAFTGPIAILVDEGTASTSEIFAMGMRDIGRVSIVGAGPSAGMALPSLIETLPDGGMIQYVVGDYHSTKGSAAEGDGVVPELTVPESRIDYAAGRDPVLDAAVDLLRRKLVDAPQTPPPPGG
ncbi:MAG: hypothetical protein KC457_15860 [Myxococcales bacterium]|nr:hypothetical protein [Myxococcales bacterium]